MPRCRPGGPARTTTPALPPAAAIERLADHDAALLTLGSATPAPLAATAIPTAPNYLVLDLDDRQIPDQRVVGRLAAGRKPAAAASLPNVQGAGPDVRPPQSA